MHDSRERSPPKTQNQQNLKPTHPDRAYTAQKLSATDTSEPGTASTILLIFQKNRNKTHLVHFCALHLTLTFIMICNFTD